MPAKDSDDSALITAPRNETTKRIFIAATRMNDGKTTTSLALFAALQGISEKVGFIKPIGQRFVELDGHQIDEDSVLLNQTFNVEVPIQAMSPIAIHSNFTREYLNNPAKMHPGLIDKMCRAFDRAAYEKEYIIIEGTGHAGVGSVCDLSNADVAKRLDAKVIIIAKGGIGRPIDEIALNKALFEAAGVEVIGAIINKVLPSKMEEVGKFCRIALDRMGIPLLGCMPEEQKLLRPSLSQIVKEIDGRWVNGRKQGDRERISKVIIGAMTAKGLLNLLERGTLIVTPGDREDIILSAIAAEGLSEERTISGIVLTRDLLPHSGLMEMLARTSIPVVVCGEESYRVASLINTMTVKTQPDDDDKIPLIKNLIKEHIDMDAIEDAFDSRSFAPKNKL